MILVPVDCVLLRAHHLRWPPPAALNDLGAAADTQAPAPSQYRGTPRWPSPPPRPTWPPPSTSGRSAAQSWDFAAAIGPDDAPVTIDCHVQVADLTTLVPVPGSVTLTGAATEVLDTFRERP